MKVPAILFSSERNFEKSDVLEKIEKLSQNKEVFHHIAVSSEAHTRAEIENPTGSIIASSKILPEMLDAAPNCGMRVLLTDISENEIDKKKLKGLLENIENNILSKELIGTKISLKTVLDIFQNGSGSLLEKNEIKNERENSLSQGNFFLNKKISKEEILEAIPKIIFYLAKYRIGLLGEKKSHFIHFMKVSSIENNDLAEKIGLKKNQYLFFMHTGSSIVGRYTASLYTKRKVRKKMQKIILLIIKLLSGFSSKKVSQKNIDTAFRAVGNYGFANRTILSQEIEKVLEKTFERKVSLSLLYDAPHVYFEKENHFNQEVIIHRNGSNRAFGPKRMASHSIFSKTGEPVLIAPFAKKVAYICVGNDENEETFFSANHEIGKIKHLEIPQNKEEEYAEKIIREMEKNKIIKLVAKLKPVKF